MNDLERIIKRIWIALIVATILIVGARATWFYYEAFFK